MLESLWVKNPWGKNRVDGMLAFVPPSQVSCDHDSIISSGHYSYDYVVIRSCNYSYNQL